ncbi:IS630 family transposase [Streptomyces sp. NPDC012950]|uniref:IS630 family transposase n=1 Tax=Streptomyces sp. NPDC012950 TaxID=3364858 RepID=UPI0036C64673
MSGEKTEPVCADQCGLRSDTAPPGRSWAPAGRTPLVRVNGRRFGVNIMSAVASRGALWSTVFPGRFTAEVFCTFPDRLARQGGRKVHVIIDRHPVHRSKTVRAWLIENAERVELHLLPGYSPELNPDELLNTDPKHHVHAARAASADDPEETHQFRLNTSSVSSASRAYGVAASLSVAARPATPPHKRLLDTRPIRRSSR